MNYHINPLIRLYTLALLLLTSTILFAQTKPLSLLSPDGKIKITIVAVKTQLTYAVTIDGQIVVKPSHLGLDLKNGTFVGKEVLLKSATRRSNNTSWKNPLGKSSTVRDQYNELHLKLIEKSNANSPFELMFRAYNDGIAFRYFIPKQTGDTIVITNEETEFAFSADFDTYSGHHPKYTFRGSQEWEFLPGKITDIKKDSAIGLPLLVKTPVAWLAVTEADLLDWSGMWLSKNTKVTENNPYTFVSTLAPRLDKDGLVKINTPHYSPWRVIMIGRQPGDLTESNIILNLSTPSKIGDASWIHPGIMAWDNWWSGDVKMNTATIKQYIQLAADMGWPYQLIDWQWYGPYNKPNANITTVNPDVDMDEVRRFAKEKNVRLWLWLYSSDVDRNDAFKTAFAQYEKWGIAGIKIDFMDRDDQEMVNWYEKIAKAAAEHHLMLDFHGAYKPTGLERTYPNQITREGILGNEYNRWSKRVTTTHKITLLFTRLLTGPGDFTPGGFLNRQPEQFKADGKAAEVQGTRASELALFVLYNSPIIVACDHPDHYRNQPGADFLKIVPTVWDETKMLKADVANYAVMARRSGKDWFIGALTNNNDRQFTIPLSFLNKGQYKLTIWKDAPDSKINAEHLDSEEQIVTSSNQLNIEMVRNGGYVARLQKIDNLKK
jgi:alpha-glucosidase